MARGGYLSLWKERLVLRGVRLVLIVRGMLV